MPVPVEPFVNVTTPLLLAVAVHAQKGSAELTVTLPAPPPLGKLADAGATVTVHTLWRKFATAVDVPLSARALSSLTVPARTPVPGKLKRGVE